MQILIANGLESAPHGSDQNALERLIESFQPANLSAVKRSLKQKRDFQQQEFVARWLRLVVEEMRKEPAADPFQYHWVPSEVIFDCAGMLQRMAQHEPQRLMDEVGEDTIRFMVRAVPFLKRILEPFIAGEMVNMLAEDPAHHRQTTYAQPAKKPTGKARHPGPLPRE